MIRDHPFADPRVPEQLPTVSPTAFVPSRLLATQDEALRNNDPYARMSDSYGSHADQKAYPRGTLYKKNPNIIDAWDPDEKPKRPGEGARVSDVYGAHYRDPKYKVPRGGVALSAHGIPDPLDDDDEAEASRPRPGTQPRGRQAQGWERHRGNRLPRRARSGDVREVLHERPGVRGVLPGPARGQEERVAVHRLGSQRQNWVDPYENYRGGVPRLEQRPLPKTMDMDDGLLMHMAPQRREHAAPKGGEKRQELERFRRQQATLQGINDMSIQDSNRLGVGKKDPRARPDDQRLIKSLLPEKEGGEYKIDHTTRAKTEHSGRDFESHFSGVTLRPAGH